MSVTQIRENSDQWELGSARHLDKFYTNDFTARRCIALAKEIALTRLAAPTWVEPAAGDGAFLRHLPIPKLGLDISPAHDEIIEADFLTWRPPLSMTHIVVIGNPPFGKNASKAMRFFNHAAAFASLIALIVPRTFQKVSTHRKLNLSMHLVREIEIGSDAFLFAGLPYDVPTVFQIWERRRCRRIEKRSVTEHPHFEFVTAACADFAFQRVGARAGLVSDEGLRKSPQSHYFIKANTGQTNVRSVLSAFDWEPIKWRTAGNPSIGKAELVEAYAKAIE